MSPWSIEVILLKVTQDYITSDVKQIIFSFSVVYMQMFDNVLSKGKYPDIMLSQVLFLFFVSFFAEIQNTFV